MKSIEFVNVTKTFYKGQNYLPSLRDWFTRLISGKKVTYEKFKAIKNISLSIDAGETVGFVGSNGAGKSTFLKLVSKVTRPTTGEIRTKGKIAGLLELGAGFHLELTGRENIVFKGMLLGNNQKMMEEKFDEIVKFSGLKSFIDMPVKNYSSGMFARLGFSIAIHVDPDILLIDEVLSVGDESFRKKCFSRIKNFCKDKNKTVVFVSHNLAAAEDLCDRVIWLDKGRVMTEGRSKEVIKKYLKATVKNGK